MKVKKPMFFFIDDAGSEHVIFDDFSSPYPYELAVYPSKGHVEVVDSQGFVMGEFTLHHIETQVAA